MGADYVVVTDEEDLGATVKTITDGKGVRLIYDCIAGQFFDKIIDSVAIGGEIIVYGALDTRPFHVNLAKMVLTEARLRPYSMITVFNNLVRRTAGLNYISGRLATGAFRPVIDRVFELDEIVDAYRYMLAGNQKGKIVVRVP